MGNFTVYRASAGSGKTFNLVVEYLCLALRDDNPTRYRRILGVTFTNKAANELKERILRFLKQISLQADQPGSNPALAEKIAGELGITPRELTRRARQAHTDILHNYSSLAISTIDKFVHRLIRSFARELNLNIDFEIELDTYEVFRGIAHKIISQAGEDEALTRALQEWIRGKLENGQSVNNLEDELTAFIKELNTDEATLQREKIRSFESDILNGLQKDLIKKARDFEKKIAGIGEVAQRIIAEAGLTDDDFPYKATGPQHYFRKIVSPGETRDYLPGKRAIEFFVEGRRPKTAHPKLETVSEKLVPLFNEAHTMATDLLPAYTLNRMLSRQLYLLRLTLKIESELQHWREETNHILISDFNKKIAEVIVNEPAPFIYEIMGERYDHFLIDEFQDTSVLQWQNFLPLIDNSLAKGGKTLLVGDGKQSIYRFRSGEVEQFQALPELIPLIDQHARDSFSEGLARNFRLVNMQHNFRSATHVISFNNGFITSLREYLSPEHYRIFEDGLQLAVKEHPGYVQVKCIETDEDDDERNLAEIIADLELLAAKGYGRRDTCILTRGKKEAEKIVRHLLMHHIPVVSAENLLVLQSPKTRALLACLELIQDNRNQLAQLDLLEGCCQLNIMKSTPEELFRQYTTQKKYGDKRLIQMDVTRIFQDLGIPKSIAELKRYDLYTLTEFLAAALGFMKKPDPFVQFFLDETHHFIHHFGNHFSAFTSWWRANAGKQSVKLPESLDAVRVMTIHKSKGLEFENVILPYLKWRSQPTKNVVWIDPGEGYSPLQAVPVKNQKELELTRFQQVYDREGQKDKLDEANLLYVALTRAATNLFVYSGIPTIHREKNVCFHFNNWVKGHPQFDKANNTLVLGKLENKERPNTQQKEAEIRLEQLITRDFHEKLHIGYQAPRHWDVGKTISERELGTRLHAILSRIHGPEDLDKVLSSMRNTYAMTPAETEELEPKLKKIIEECCSRQWMGPGIRGINELEMAVQDKEGRIMRPDRVVFHPGKTIVIDYKTGAMKPEYHGQIKTYMEALQQLGYPAVEGKLLFFETLEIIDVL